MDARIWKRSWGVGGLGGAYELERGREWEKEGIREERERERESKSKREEGGKLEVEREKGEIKKNQMKKEEKSARARAQEGSYCQKSLEKARMVHPFLLPCLPT